MGPAHRQPDHLNNEGTAATEFKGVWSVPGERAPTPVCTNASDHIVISCSVRSLHSVSTRLCHDSAQGAGNGFSATPARKHLIWVQPGSEHTRTCCSSGSYNSRTPGGQEAAEGTAAAVACAVRTPELAGCQQTQGQAGSITVQAPKPKTGGPRLPQMRYWVANTDYPLRL
ncbi:hypothetical protein NDU88_005880 [Pleurodeles waltl]|uniref:Uncharacterized protein n=1 Tax=Pleurodeles waltl TaxID=8319 RepID=A0AAV7PJF1_PLEWA|nr:hypothetical protein NDU88_005880 [Pleurodeles waltl]